MMPVVLSCQSIYQVHFVCNMYSGIVTRSNSNTFIKCGTTEKVGASPEIWIDASPICRTVASLGF
jgi:hypothetical protein